MDIDHRLAAYLDTVGDPIPTTDADRYKPRPPWTAPPEPLIPLLRDTVAYIDELEEALSDMTEERDMYQARCDELERETAA